MSLEQDATDAFFHCGRLAMALELMLDRGPYTERHTRQTAREALVEYREFQQRRRGELVQVGGRVMPLDDWLDEQSALHDQRLAQGGYGGLGKS